jgi:hypothetical protein
MPWACARVLHRLEHERGGPVEDAAHATDPDVGQAAEQREQRESVEDGGLVAELRAADAALEIVPAERDGGLVGGDGVDTRVERRAQKGERGLAAPHVLRHAVDEHVGAAQLEQRAHVAGRVGAEAVGLDGGDDLHRIEPARRDPTAVVCGRDPDEHRSIRLGGETPQERATERAGAHQQDADA